MRNPYEVLGVRQGATQDEIKKAYKNLVKRYHPDQYRDNPLSSLAEEKLKEINEAYDYLSKNGNSSSYGYENNYNQYDSGNSSSSYQEIRMNINNGNIGAAEELLNSSGFRNSEWYYLKGVINIKKGWYSEAYSSLQTAVSMEPNNFEYREAFNRVKNVNRSYSQRPYSGGNYRNYDNGSDWCTICSWLWCADTCCECTGGDLIGCC